MTVTADTGFVRQLIVLAARLLLASLFLWDAWTIFGNFDATRAYMEANGVSGMLLPLVMLLQAVGGLCIALGWQASLAALGLAAFCLSTAVMFHTPLGEIGERIQFWKDLALAGGLLLLFVHGAGRVSVDHYLARRGVSID